MASPNNQEPRHSLEKLLPSGSFWWLLESAPDGIVIVDSDGAIALANTQAERLFGYSEDELIGQPVETLIPDHLRRKHMSHRAKYHKTPQTRPMGIGMELSGRRKDGSTFPVEISLSPVNTERGPLVMAIIRDITEYTRERFIADTLQRAMLSTVPEKLNGIRVASAYHSAYTGALVGGDFFDLFDIKPGLIGIAIGDASGKGVEASVRTALVKYSLRAYAYQECDPSSVMEQLNDTVYRQANADDFVTAFYGTLNTRDHTLIFANAGHMLPMYLPHSGTEVSELVVAGMPLGVLQDTQFENHTLQLHSGDRLLLYSDGVTEAHANGDLYGVERLKDFFQERASREPAEFVDELLATLQDWSGGRLHDDVALLLLSME